MDATRSLPEWLAWLETLHPREIELGLTRLVTVRDRLQQITLPFPVITVGGTNGKGSVVAMLEHVLHAAGYRVGSYTSPHLLRYNERVRLDTTEASDDALVAAFEKVEAARGDTALTYFEFGTLAAVELFRDAALDVAVLEVGLGGRLDAVNAWDADVAIVTSIGTDHRDWLGPDRESIGFEKAGIYRAGQCAICGDRAPPVSLVRHAEAIGARLLCLGKDFDFEVSEQGWTWHRGQRLQAGLPHPAMRGDYQLDNAACVLTALDCLASRFPVTGGEIRSGLTQALLPGRFQTLPGRPLVVLDVAHNAEAAEALQRTLRAQPVRGRTLAVCAMLRDKPIADVVRILAPRIAHWHVAGLAGARACSAGEMEAAVSSATTSAVTKHERIEVAYAAAMRDAGIDDRIVVFGSFQTVGAILRQLQNQT